MALENKLLQKLSQNLLMTPQLRHAIELLQLGRLEYLEAIEKELLENPLLEEVKEENTSSISELQPSSTDGEASQNESSAPGSESGEAEPPPPDSKEPAVDWEDYLENFTDYRGSATPKGMIDHDNRPTSEASSGKDETLTEHLLVQLRDADFSHHEKRIMLHIIGNLDRNGYLCASNEEIAEECSCTVMDVEHALDGLRSLDPPGVGARDLKECLVIQLESQGKTSCLETKIVLNHLDKLEKRRFDLIAKAEQVAVEEVYKAVSAIQQLEPRPGRTFSDEATRYIVPDIYVHKFGNEYVITLNEDGLPKLRVSPYYLELLRNEGNENDPNKTYLSDRLKAASWLIRSIHQRQQTMYRVTESIVKFQRAFLDHGISKLKPLVLKDVADDIGMHESTVSRVTTNKYVHTPQGVYELKYFFTTGIKTSEGDLSSSFIKEKIKSIISVESPEDPISDQGIVEKLQAGGITIARRTVAKYRENLGIASSSRRKRLF